MEVNVYNQKGEIVEKTELPSEIFCLKINSDLIHQVVIVQLANKRLPFAHTKDRSEVSGSGRKIWPQKHMGRARHGDIRAPIFRKGGVAHGPRNKKNLKKKIPQKMRKKAVLMVLSAKAKDKEIILMDDLKIEKPKTKLFNEILENLKKKNKNLKKGKILIVIPEQERNLFLAARNVKGIRILEARNLNCLDLLSYKFLLMPKAAINKIKETFLK